MTTHAEAEELANAQVENAVKLEIERVMTLKTKVSALENAKLLNPISNKKEAHLKKTYF